MLYSISRIGSIHFCELPVRQTMVEQGPMMKQSCLPYNGQERETQATNAVLFPHSALKIVSPMKYFFQRLSVMWYGVFIILEYK